MARNNRGTTQREVTGVSAEGARVIDATPLPEAARAWKGPGLPTRILVIRMHAVGDVAIALSATASMLRRLPGAQADFLTGPESVDMAGATGLFDRLWVVRGRQKRSFQFAELALLMPQLIARRYEVVVDLQNNELSRAARRLIMPKAWVAFDRYSWFHAFDRCIATIRGLQLPIELVYEPLVIPPPEDVDLARLGLAGGGPLVVINPAGLWRTRSWPLENYARFCELYRQSRKGARFLVIGLDSLRDKALWLQRELGDDVVDLTGKTNLAEALRLLSLCELVVSEDSGLMHMAWLLGVNTVGLLGSTPWQRGGPYGDTSIMFDSSDLPCGGCMSPECRFGDVPCLSRVQPEQLIDACRTKFGMFRA